VAGEFADSADGDDECHERDVVVGNLERWEVLRVGEWRGAEPDRDNEFSNVHGTGERDEREL
jgi:hypothetical protein